MALLVGLQQFAEQWFGCLEEGSQLEHRSLIVDSSIPRCTQKQSEECRGPPPSGAFRDQWAGQLQVYCHLAPVVLGVAGCSGGPRYMASEAQKAHGVFGDVRSSSSQRGAAEVAFGAPEDHSIRATQLFVGRRPPGLQGHPGKVSLESRLGRRVPKLLVV